MQLYIFPFEVINNVFSGVKHGLFSYFFLFVYFLSPRTYFSNGPSVRKKV